MMKGADIPECGRYRYRLWRWWDHDKPLACWIMLNPSRADAEQDDPTIRKCIGFTKRWAESGLHDCGGIMVVNLFAFRATHTNELQRQSANIIGEPRDPYARDEDADVSEWVDIDNVNDVFLYTEAEACSLVVAAWGNYGWLRGRGEIVKHELHRRKVPVHHLGMTQEDHPRHPGRIAYATPLQRWWDTMNDVGPD